MTDRRKKILIAIVCLLTLAATLAYIFLSDSPAGPDTTNPTELEGPGTIIIDNTQQLSDILLPTQYEFIYSELIRYMQTKLDSRLQHAVIKSTVLNQDSSIDLTIDPEGGHEAFLVHISRPSLDEIIMSVPASGYEVRVNPYQ